jgi:hypothetical protein
MKTSKRMKLYTSVGMLSLLLVTAVSGAIIFQNIPTTFSDTFAATGDKVLPPDSRYGRDYARRSKGRTTPTPTAAPSTPKPTVKPSQTPTAMPSKPTPTAKPSPTPSVSYNQVTDANISVNQSLMLSRPDDKDPANYYYFKITGTIQNNNRVNLTDVRITSTFESWFAGVTKPELLNLQVIGLPKNAGYNGETELLVVDPNQNPALAANDNKLYGPDQVQFVFEIRAKRQTRDVVVNNLLTFNGHSKDVNKNVFNQSLIPITIPAKQ